MTNEFVSATHSQSELGKIHETSTSAVAAMVELEKRMKKQFQALESSIQERDEFFCSKIETMMSFLKQNVPDRRSEKALTQEQVHIQTPQVRISDPESSRSDPFPDTRGGNRTVSHRDSLIKRLEMPKFEGKNPYGWIASVERFFRICGYDDEEKLELVSVSLLGDVLSWFNSDVHISPFLNWTDFKQRLVVRFNKENYRDPCQPFFAVKHTASVAEYVHEFEDLLPQTYGLSNGQIESVFMNGLKLEMREVVNMSRPSNLREMVSIALRMESSCLYRVISREMDIRRSKEICYKCDAKWFREHSMETQAQEEIIATETNGRSHGAAHEANSNQSF